MRRRKSKIIGVRPSYVAKKSIFEVIHDRWFWLLLGLLLCAIYFGVGVVLVDLWKIKFVDSALNIVIHVVIAFLLHIPLLKFIYHAIDLKQTRIEFYEERIVIREGWLNKNERVMLFMGITEVRKKVSFWDILFGYGTIYISGVSDFNVRPMKYIKRPRRLQRYLNRNIISASSTNRVVNIG